MPRIKLCVMSPNVAVKLFLPRASQYTADFACRNLLHWPNLSRNPLQLGCLFQGKRGNCRILNGITTHSDAVVLQHQRHIVADGITSHLTCLLGIDLPVEIEDRHVRRENRTAVSNRKNIDASNSECGGIGRMGVDDRSYVRPRLHDFKMQKTLVDWLDAALEPLAFDIDRYDVIHVGVD